MNGNDTFIKKEITNASYIKLQSNLSVSIFCQNKSTNEPKCRESKILVNDEKRERSNQMMNDKRNMPED